LKFVTGLQLGLGSDFAERIGLGSFLQICVTRLIDFLPRQETVPDAGKQVAGAGETIQHPDVAARFADGQSDAPGLTRNTHPAKLRYRGQIELVKFLKFTTGSVKDFV
jgi:hypothetical protein